jgi:LacI family transcriptional regulator
MTLNEDKSTPPAKPSATIRDVASKAGVSIATISRVFSGSAKVSETTSARVRRVAADMGYWPNGAARSLITKRSNALGILLPDLYGEFFSEVIRGMDLAARREGFHLVLSGYHTDSKELIDSLRSMRGSIDGLIAMAPHIENPEAICESSGQLPIVLLTPGHEVERCHTISIDDFNGAREITRHLMAQGHRAIAFVKGPKGNIESQQRLDGYRTALREGGVQPTSCLELEGDFGETGGCQAASRLLGADTRPSAVVCSNDYTAVGVLRTFRENGIAVPEEIAVTGFDDIELAAYTTPPLTTVRVEMYQMGERAVQLLIGSLRNGRKLEIQHEVLPTSIVVRSSCGARRVRETAQPRGA